MIRRGLVTVMTFAAVAFAAVASTAAAAHAESLPPLVVPEDRHADYEVLELRLRGDNGFVEIVTRRTGPRATSYSRRLVDCESRTAKFLGFGQTLDEMLTSRPETHMTPLNRGSSTYAAAMYACEYTRELRQPAGAAALTSSPAH